MEVEEDLVVDLHSASTPSLCITKQLASYGGGEDLGQPRECLMCVCLNVFCILFVILINATFKPPTLLHPLAHFFARAIFTSIVIYSYFYYVFF
jgi:hypothetical protein